MTMAQSLLQFPAETGHFSPPEWALWTDQKQDISPILIPARCFRSRFFHAHLTILCPAGLASLCTAPMPKAPQKHLHRIPEALVTDSGCVEAEGAEGKLHDGAGAERADQRADADRAAQQPADQGGQA